MRRFLGRNWRFFIYPGVLLVAWLVLAVGISGFGVFPAVLYRLGILPGAQRATYRIGHGLSPLAFAKDGQILIAGSAQSEASDFLALLDVKTGREVSRINHQGTIRALAISSDGVYLYVGWEFANVDQYDFATRQLLKTFSASVDSLVAIDVTRDGRILASGGFDKKITLWDTGKSNLQEPRTLIGHRQAITSLAMSPDGKTIASSSYDGTIKVWTMAAGELLTTLQGPSLGVSSVCYSPDGSFLASGGGDGDGAVLIWDARSYQRLKKLEDENRRGVYSIAFSPNGKTIATGGQSGDLKLWDLTSETRTHVLKGHLDAIHCVLFSPDGKSLASSSRDGTVRLWDVPPD